jgi:hypothetical protein
LAISDRPGGLTALAALNGFFAISCAVPGLDRILSSYRLLAHLQDPEATADRWSRRDLQSLIEADVDPQQMELLGILGLVVALLLAVSVWGLLKRNHWAGKWGSTLAAVGMASVSWLAVEVLPLDQLRGVGMDLVRQMFYPLFLLIMVHGIFRKDLRLR